MAGAERTSVADLTPPEPGAAALEKARRRGFFALLALLERLSPDAPRLGGLGPIAEEPVRLRHAPVLTFSAADVSAVWVHARPRDPTDPLSPPRRVTEVETTFLGLTGEATPLPLYLAEEIALEDPDRPTQRDFLDIFHHRLLSLLYRLGSKYDYAREFLRDAGDAWSPRVLALAGLDPGAPQPAGIPRWRLLRLAPLLGRGVRSAWALEAALRDVFRDLLGPAGVEVVQFVGGWTRIEQPQRMLLGRQNHRLGDSAVIGTKIFDRTSRFRIVLGPFGDASYRRFLPGGDRLPALVDVVRTFVRDPLECELEIILAEGAAPAFTLTAQAAAAARLGRETWLRRQAGERRLTVDVPL